MAGWIKGAAVVAGVVAGGAVAVATAGRRRWSSTTSRAIERLDAAASLEPEGVPARARGLPEPVARYFEFALTPGRAPVAKARIEHAGDFRTGGPTGRWSPFRSVQHYTADPPGFVWDAAIRMAPLVTVRVRDSYVAGRAAMLAKVAGVVSVVDQQGTPELAAGALHRWLGEAVWFPSALLPRPGLRWDGIDDETARVSVRDGDVSVSLECRFAEDGRMLGVSAERFRDVDGVGVPTPWRVDFGEYVERGGMRIPVEAEVAWIVPEGRFAYWRGRVVRAAYRFVR